MSVFELVSNIVGLIISVVPRFVLIRPTHKGVKWPWGGSPLPLDNGIHWYWPLVTQYEAVVSARQTNPLPPQSIRIEDESYTVRGVAVFSIADVVLAVGQRNWDVDSTVNDLCQAAIMDTCASKDHDTILYLDELNEEITSKAQTFLTPYGINLETCRLLEIARTKTYRIFGDGYLPVEE